MSTEKQDSTVVACNTHVGDGTELLAYLTVVSVLCFFIFVGLNTLVVQNELGAPRVGPAHAQNHKRK